MISQQCPPETVVDTTDWSLTILLIINIINNDKLNSFHELVPLSEQKVYFIYNVYYHFLENIDSNIYSFILKKKDLVMRKTSYKDHAGQIIIE